LTGCLERERVGFCTRLRVAAGRIAESEDDELAYAYYAANETERPYNRRHFRRAYARRAYGLCREHHVAHGMALIFNAVGLRPYGLLVRAGTRIAWHVVRYRAIRLAKVGA
jgi:hypothetical protein